MHKFTSHFLSMVRPGENIVFSSLFCCIFLLRVVSY